MTSTDNSFLARIRPANIRSAGRQAMQWIPPEARAEVAQAFSRVRESESPRDALTVLEEEIERIFETLAPAMIEHPLPVRTKRAALTTVATAAGAAAALDELELLSALLPGVDAVAVPSLPLVLGAAFLALIVEAYVAASYRVHALRDAGHAVDSERVMHDVLRAMTGRDDATFTNTAARSMSRRITRRWARGVIPFVGVGYSSIDAQKTIRTIARMPMPPLQV